MRTSFGNEFHNCCAVALNARSPRVFLLVLGTTSAKSSCDINSSFLRVALTKAKIPDVVINEAGKKKHKSRQICGQRDEPAISVLEAYQSSSAIAIESV